MTSCYGQKLSSFEETGISLYEQVLIDYFVEGERNLHLEIFLDTNLINKTNSPEFLIDITWQKEHQFEMKQVTVQYNDTLTELYEFDKAKRLFINITCSKVIKKELKKESIIEITDTCDFWGKHQILTYNYENNLKKKIVITGTEKPDTVTSYYNILINQNNSSITETYIQKAIDLSQKSGTYLHFNTTGKTRKFINKNKSIYTYMNCWTSTNGASQGSMYIATIIANYSEDNLTRIDLIRNEKIIKFITVKDI